MNNQPLQPNDKETKNYRKAKMPKKLKFTIIYAVLIGVLCVGILLYACFEDKLSKGLEYNVISDTTCEITGIGTCTDKKIVIPNVIDGYNVISIGKSAFSECRNLTSIEIPEGVTSIGDEAFSCCSNLKNIYIPESVISVGNKAFSSCFSLESIEISEGVASIGDSAFLMCNNLTRISVSSGNTSYKSVNGVLFNYDKTALICYPAGKQEAQYTIPKGVTSIEDSAFCYCERLTSIEIPESVTSIGDFTFSLCSSLTSIAIPESVTTIEDYAFAVCDSLTSITYDGTVSEWEEMTKGMYWIDGIPNHTIYYTVYCTDGTVAKDGTVRYN